MRFLAGTLLLMSAVICFVLGVLHVLSSKYEQFRAQDAAGDLSSVSKDLTNKEELEKMHLAVKGKMKSVGNREMSLGLVSLGLGLLQVISSILVLCRRPKFITLSLIGVSLLGWGGVLIIDGYRNVGAIAWLSLLLALLFTSMMKTVRHAPIS